MPLHSDDAQVLSTKHEQLVSRHTELVVRTLEAVSPPLVSHATACSRYSQHSIKNILTNQLNFSNPDLNAD